MKKNDTNSIIFSLIGCTLLLYPILIVWDIGYRGIHLLNLDFILGTPANFGKSGGIFTVTFSTMVVVSVSILISIPFSIFLALYISLVKSSFQNLIDIAIDILAGIPSILFGMFGFSVFVIELRLGWSILSGALTISFMLMPLLTKLITASIRAIPSEYREEAFMSGASDWQYYYLICFPLILWTIVASTLLSIRRVAGETAVLLMTVGSSLIFPRSLLDSARPMSIHIFILAKDGISYDQAFGTALVLLIFVSLANMIGTIIVRYHHNNMIIGSG